MDSYSSSDEAVLAALNFVELSESEDLVSEREYELVILEGVAVLQVARN